MTAPDEGLADVATETAALVAAVEAYLVMQQLVVVRRLRRSAETGDVPAALTPIPIVADEWDGDVWDAQLGRVISGRALRLGAIGAGQVLDVWNPTRAGWSPDVMSRWLLAAVAGHAKRANEATYRVIAEALVDGDAVGWENRVTGALETRRARVPLAIGSGVSAEAVSFGGYDAARASGLTTKTWHVTSGKPRASHAAIDGLSIPLDGVFPNGARWPGDAFAGSSESAGCTCYLTFGVA